MLELHASSYALVDRGSVARYHRRAVETARMSKLAKFRRKKRFESKEPKRNPPIGTDIIEYILPATAAFVGSRFVTRVATAQISKRFPKVAKHAGAIAAAGSFAAAWFGAHRVRYLEPYHHPIVVGAGLAAVQSLVQLYLPRFGWILGDPTPEPIPQAAMPAAQSQAQITAPAQVPDGFQETSAAEWHAYNDAYDAGSYKGKPAAPVQTQQAPQQTEPDVSDILDNSDLNLGNEDMGLFS